MAADYSSIGGIADAPVAAKTADYSSIGGIADPAPAAAAPMPLPNGLLTKTENAIHEGAVGVAQGAKDIYGVAKGMVPGGPAETGAIKGIWDSLPPVQLHDAVEQVLPLIDQYEKSRTAGKSVSDSLVDVNSAAKQHIKNTSALPAIVDSFRANPTRTTARALTDAAAAAASMLVPGAAEAAPEAAAAEVPEAAAVTAPAANPSLISRINPFRRGGLTGAAAAQPEAQAAVRQGATAAAADSGVTATAPSGGVRTLLDDSIGKVAVRERATYDTLNTAAKTDMKDLYERAEELQDAIDDPTNIVQKPAMKIELERTNMQIKNGEANVQATLGKSAPDVLKSAKADTQQRYSLMELKKAVYNNEGVVDGNAAAGTSERIKIDSAIKNVEKLDKPSRYAPEGSPTRLVQALGKDGAADFKRALYTTQKNGQIYASRQQVAKWLGGLVGGGTILEVGRHALP